MFKQSQRIKLLKQKEKENQLMHNYFQQIWKTQEGLTKDLVNIYYHDQDQIRLKVYDDNKKMVEQQT